MDTSIEHSTAPASVDLPPAGPLTEPPPAGAPFGQSEDAYVTEHYPTFGAAKVAAALHRPLSSIHKRARQLNLPRPHGWLASDLAILSAHYELIGPRGCQRLLSVPRSIKAIQVMSSRMKLFFRPGAGPEHGVGSAARPLWRPEEDALLRSKVGTMTLARLHRQYFTGVPFTRSYPAVAQRCGAIGISLSRDEAARLALQDRAEVPPV